MRIRTITAALAVGGMALPAAAPSTNVRRLHRDLGGFFGWEYFTSQPGGTAAPWRWAGLVREAMRH